MALGYTNMLMVGVMMIYVGMRSSVMKGHYMNTIWFAFNAANVLLGIVEIAVGFNMAGAYVGLTYQGSQNDGIMYILVCCRYLRLLSWLEGNY